MLKQFLNLKLSQKLSPQQIQLMKLIQLPTQAFEQRLKEEINENPALETGDEEEEIYEKDEFDNNEEYDDYEDNESIDSGDVNIDEYLSNDETPEYKLQANNYSDDDEDRHDGGKIEKPRPLLRVQRRAGQICSAAEFAAMSHRQAGARCFRNRP